tara:strand:+ start:229 stop:489 length:261 start_codon:yes stop_codon:yes gene_type:complete
MMNTAALENIERYLNKVSERAQKASDLLHSGLYGKNEDGEGLSSERLATVFYLLEGKGNESSISELTGRVLGFVEHELSTREDQSA